MDVVSETVGGLAHPSGRFLAALPDGYVLRRRLHSLLAQHADARLILVCAPAGSGKSSLLAELIACRQAQGTACTWLSLGASDNEPAHFLARLLRALRIHLSGIGDGLLKRLASGAGLSATQVLEGLLSELGELSRPLLLVLDDWAITDADLLAALSRFIRLAPPGLTLVIACDQRPAFNLAALRAKGQLLEIGLGDLSLSLDETRELVQARTALEEDALQTLHGQTEGWLAGVLHARPALAGSPTPASPWPDDLTRLFEEQPPRMRETLLTLGVPSRLNRELVAALTGRDEGQEVLEELEARQLFLISLDRERGWYRFHRQFAAFLQERLRRENAERFRQLHFKVSLWFTNHHMQALAIEHACLAEDAEMLAALVGGYGLELINRGQLRRLYRWRHRIPDALVQRQPILMLVDAWDKAATLSLAEANRVLDDLLACWTNLDEGPLQDGRLAVLAVKAMLALQKDDLSACVALVRRIETRLGQQSAFLEAAILLMGALAHAALAQPEQARRLIGLARQRNHFLEGHYLDMQLGNLEVFLNLQQGRLCQADMLSRQLLSRGRSCMEPGGAAMVLPEICASLIAYQQGRFEGLEERLRAALDAVDVINPIDLYARGMLCLARLQRLQGQNRVAQNTLVEVQNLTARHQSWRFYAQAVAEEILALLQEPGTERIRRAEQRLKTVDWERQMGCYEQQNFNPVRWALGLTRVRLHQARHNYSEALHEINQLRGLLPPGWQELQRLRLDALAAVSYQRLGYHERAQSLLTQCLLGAEREGARALFIEEGAEVRDLLQRLESVERQPALQGFLRELIGLWPGGQAEGEQENPGEALTERELEVIRLAAEGLSNEAIGQCLGLALGTVKWHLHNIYEKFRVRNRTQAIRRARDLGVLA